MAQRKLKPIEERDPYAAHVLATFAQLSADRSQQDAACGSCAYRVNERVVKDASISSQMTCLHPSVHREACADARDERGACGPDANLWVKRCN